MENFLKGFQDIIEKKFVLDYVISRIQDNPNVVKLLFRPIDDGKESSLKYFSKIKFDIKIKQEISKFIQNTMKSYPTVEDFGKDFGKFIEIKSSSNKAQNDISALKSYGHEGNFIINELRFLYEQFGPLRSEENKRKTLANFDRLEEKIDKKIGANLLA